MEVEFMPRFSIDVDSAFDNTLNELVKDTNATTKADVIRRAVASYKYLKDEEKNQDSKISVTDNNGNVKKDIVLP
jgi:metal-responsive CopG/Arc/MetJ family transcriptional regulator